MKNNKKINILLAVIMIFTITVVPTNATVHVQKEETIETKLLDKIVDSGLSQESIDSKTIKKISSKEAKAIVNFEDDSKKYIDKYNVYIIEDLSKPRVNEKTATLVTDIYLTNEGMSKLGINPKAGGGSLYNESQCGRVTGYVKVWYTSKTFNGIEAKKITQIGSKLTYVPGGVTVRSLKAVYYGVGTYYTSSGYSPSDGGLAEYVREWPLSTSSITTLKTKDTSSIDRYYNTRGAGGVRGSTRVTYGGTTPNSQFTYQVDLDICHFIQ